MSRAVVREAIARLQSDGYVETRQGAGVFLTARPGLRSFKLPDEGEPGPAELQHILELRLAVEVHAADLAAVRRTEVDLAAMRRELGALAEAVRAGTDASDADDRFHAAIAAATHNPYLRRLVEFLRYQFFKTRRPTWSPAGHEAGEPRSFLGLHSLKRVVGVPQPRRPAPTCCPRHAGWAWPIPPASEPLGGASASAGVDEAGSRGRR